MSPIDINCHLPTTVHSYGYANDLNEFLNTLDCISLPAITVRLRVTNSDYFVVNEDLNCEAVIEELRNDELDFQWGGGSFL